jgi:uncharacterized protein DUF6655
VRFDPLPLPVLACLALLVSGCTVRETTTPRTATEVLLVSTAAERAIQSYDASPLAGRRVAIDASRYSGIDKSYVVSSLRTQVVRGGGRLVKDLRATRPEAPPPEVVIELRSGTLGIWDGDFTIGVPPLDVRGAVEEIPITSPPLYLLNRGSQQGFCKVQLFSYEVGSQRVLQREHELWGRSYYNEWWVLGFGPFLGDQDIFLEEDD